MKCILKAVLKALLKDEWLIIHLHCKILKEHMCGRALANLATHLRLFLLVKSSSNENFTVKFVGFYSVTKAVLTKMGCRGDFFKGRVLMLRAPQIKFHAHTL